MPYPADRPSYETWVPGTCRACGAYVRCSDASRYVRFDADLFDYAWQCSNEACEHHAPIGTGDMEWPEWVATRADRDHPAIDDVFRR